MRCPKCSEEGREHCVYPGAIFKTLMYCPPFYDENDVYHHHDMNHKTQRCRCSNGHSWVMTWVPRCPAEGCDHGHEPTLSKRSWQE